MFHASIYSDRRKKLKDRVGSGIIIFPGNEESPMNYPANPFHFRQDSSFLYFFGLGFPGLAGVIDIDENRDIIFGNDLDVDDIIWMGDQLLLKDRAAAVGVEENEPLSKLTEFLRNATRKGKKIHFLPTYRSQTAHWLSQCLGIEQDALKDYISIDLIHAVVDQRSIKIPEEVVEIEKALDITYKMHTTAMRMAVPGRYESEIAGVIEGLALTGGGLTAFPVILTVRGQILHNHDHSHQLQEGQLMVNDSGAESAMHYASDITRTIPVGGKFSQKQREIYQIVLNAQESAISSCRPGIKNREIHLKAMSVIAEGLKELGLMKGDLKEAVEKGAHALFMPHGLGHMMGLDVHDMECLGESFVGYSKDTNRSDQFGLAYLRLAKELKPGYVITVEPGIYFIPALIDKWVKEQKLTEFIDYSKVEEYRDFGGIRIEDDVLITETACRVLGKPIPKTVEDVEAITATD